MNSHHKSLIFAHRGLNREAAENTRQAFDKALQYPVDGMETDVQLSLDEVPVLWHDWHLDKLGHPGKCIDDFTFEQLQEIDFAGYFSPNMMFEGTLSLREFIENYRGRCGLDIELKARDDESQQRFECKILRMLDIIGSLREDGVFISSYSLSGLAFANQHAPDLPLYYLLSGHHTLTDIKQFLSDYPFLAGFCLPNDIHNEAIAQYLREQGKRAGVYTPNSKEDIQKALDLNVDILITDCPQLALEMRGA